MDGSKNYSLPDWVEELMAQSRAERGVMESEGDVLELEVQPDVVSESDSDTETSAAQENENANRVALERGLQLEEERRRNVADLDEYAEMAPYAYEEDDVYVDSADLYDGHEIIVDFEPAGTSIPEAVTTATVDNGLYRTGREGGDVAVGKRNFVHGSSHRHGHCRVRGHGNVPRAGPAESTWNPGERLQEVYLRDEDIPADIMHSARESSTRGAAVARGRGSGRGRVRGHSRGGERGDNVVYQQPGYAAGPGEIDDFTHEVMAGAAPFLFRDDPDALNFNWQPIDSFNSPPEEFLPTKTGPTQHFGNAYDSFRSVWTDDILDQIALETNRHASQHTPNENYVPTNRHEILILFAFYMLLGLIKYPTINACFSRMVLYRNNMFSAFFSRARYYWLNSHLHFADDLSVDKTSRLYQILPVIDHLNIMFKALYVPKQNITIDESLTLWKGILNFKTYIPKKVARWGIKTFELCCSETGYLWSFFVYTGSSEDSQVVSDRLSLGCPKVVSTILSLINPLLNQGYRLWMDNWFNSPLLARYLKRNGTDCCGTLRVKRLHVPRQVSMVPLQVGQFVGRHAQDISILSWMDKKRITMISTFHGNQQMSKFYGPEPEFPQQTDDASRLNIFKPRSVRDYNENMGGVDRKDQTLQSLPVERRRCHKWLLKLFKRLLNVTVLNSQILVEQSTGRVLKQRIFREELIQEIFRRHFNETATAQRHLVTVCEPLTNNWRYDLSLGHFTTPLTDTDTSRRAAAFEQPFTFNMTRPNKRKTAAANGSPTRQKCIRKRCQFCMELEKTSSNRTTFKCTVCGVPLCAYPCFALYHTKR